MNPWALIAVWYAGASVVAWIAYWRDKRAAGRGGRRVRERTLHLIELTGGWPGALAAQRVLRHKTRDAKFLVVFWMVVALHVAGWVAWGVFRK